MKTADRPGVGAATRPGSAGADARSSTALDRLVAWAACERARRAAQPPCRYDFDAAGDLILVVEADDSRRAFAYDERRRLVEVRDCDGVTRFRYDDLDRLAAVDGPRGERRYVYDGAGRLAELHRGAACGVRYRWDDAGRVTEYRTAEIACRQSYDAAGRIARVSQQIGGVELAAALEFDAAGRLAAMRIPGHRIGYAWDAAGRPAGVDLDGAPIASWRYEGCRETLRYAGGMVQQTEVDPIDGRVMQRELRRGDALLDCAAYAYDAAGRIVDDGRARYAYDAEGRLAREERGGAAVDYGYDAAGQRTAPPALADDREFLCDATGQLVEVRRGGRTLARFGYDAKGRVATMQADELHERWFYGPADELLAVTDAAGRVLRAYVHTPSGCLAEIEGGELRFLHLDRRGACRLATSADGRVLARHALDAYGAPRHALDAAGPQPWFGARRYVPQVGLYRCGARWYDPHAGRFLEPDSYTAAPDDERLVHPLVAGASQLALREQLLADWLRHPESRQRTAYCANDPVNRVDPNGHWSFGGVVLSLLGAIWTLPNTLFGLLVEVTCLVGEVVRWLAWLFSGGNLTWATPGFDAAASSRLNAFALVFRGGWLGSFRSLLGITFGNVFFVYHDWENFPALKGEGTVEPPAYGGEVEIPKRDALYEHELRHTNQYGWLGPFFHLGMPLFGFYEWDVILHGYEDAFLETDARDHGGF